MFCIHIPGSLQQLRTCVWGREGEELNSRGLVLTLSRGDFYHGADSTAMPKAYILLCSKSSRMGLIIPFPF